MYIYFPLIMIILLLFSINFWSLSNNNNKLEIYECGFNSYTYELYNYYIKYYNIAILYLLFDIEVILLYSINKYLLFNISFTLLNIIIYIIYLTLIYELVYIL